MKHSSSVFGLPLVVALVMGVGCGGDDAAATVCTAGMSVPCTGAGGCAGGQVCNADGTGFGACDCGSLDAGPTPDGGRPADGGMDGGGMVDDAGTTDAGPATCNAIEGTGCPSGERCGLVAAADTTVSRCVAEGTVDENAACTTATTGIDDCRARLACIGGACRRICALSGSPGCPTNFACQRYSGILEDEGGGVCDPTCDPVTQERLYDHAAACGSASAADPTLGCYGLYDGPFTCLDVFFTRGHGEVIPPPAYVNSCAPGHGVLRYDGMDTCVAFCTPAVSYMGADANRTGLAPHDCAARGATGATEECRYLHVFQTTPNALGNAYGLCVDYAVVGAATTFPSCSTLPNTDTDGDGVPQHVQYGCAPLP